MIPPFDQKNKKYSMTKPELIAWMRRYGWSYGDDEVVQNYISLPRVGPLAGQIMMEKLVYIPKNFTCPNVKHKSNSWVFLRLMPTGVYLTCIHRNCRITTGAIDRDRALRRGRPVGITIEEALQIVHEQGQEGIEGKILEFADKQGIFID